MNERLQALNPIQSNACFLSLVDRNNLRGFFARPDAAPCLWVGSREGKQGHKFQIIEEGERGDADAGDPGFWKGYNRGDGSSEGRITNG